LLSVIIILYAHQPAEAGSPNLVIGQKRFKVGDDLRWALPEHDDSGWTPICAPGVGRSHGAPAGGGISWRRIRFTIRNIPDGGNLGISLDGIGDADETFLNGLRIGGEGSIGKRFVRAAAAERLYRIPRSLLRSDRDNLLAVRVMNILPGGEAHETDIRVGNHGDLAIEKTRREGGVKKVETVLLTLYFAFVLSSFLAAFSGVRETEYRTFSIFAILYAVIYLLSSLLFYEAGLKTHFIQKLTFSLLSLAPAVVLVFLCQAYREKLTNRLKCMVALFTILAVLFLISLPCQTYRLLIFAWAGLLLAAIFASGILSLRAVRRRIPESVPITIGVTLLSVGTLVGMLEAAGIFAIGNIFVESAPGVGVQIMIVCFIYGADARFSRGMHGMKLFSERILVAHEEERKRLARELHDGLGQSLLATKFNLQRMNQEKEDRLIDGVVEELSGCIDELREISAGLRPPFLEEMGLAAVIRMYGNKVAAKTGIQVDIEADLQQRPSARIEDNLFRIFQEALGNAAKHSGAGNVKVSLTRSKDRVVMEVADDGHGFDYPNALSKGWGIGLKTMEEESS